MVLELCVGVRHNCSLRPKSTSLFLLNSNDAIVSQVTNANTLTGSEDNGGIGYNAKRCTAENVELLVICRLVAIDRPNAG